jgi:2-oxoglutarate ferredoxin oxidoreductase subunit beta
LTKGQYSPTSERGFVSKSSPYGTVEDPFRPAELTFGARGTFFGRVLDVDIAESVKVLVAAAKHKGASVVEGLSNCIIFNDGTHGLLATKELRAENAIYLEHGKPMIFGKNKDKGLMQEGFGLKVVKIGENGITESDLLVHDAHCLDNTLQLKLSLMDGVDFPIALGVIRDVDGISYDEAVVNQIAEVKAKKPIKSVEELWMSGEVWEIK